MIEWASFVAGFVTGIVTIVIAVIIWFELQLRRYRGN